MGKRELLIAVGFIVAGIGAYLLLGPTEPAPAPAHSLPAMVEEWRERAADSAAHASAVVTGSQPIASTLSELRLRGFADVEVIGEDRGDLSWQLTTEATGATADVADAAAKQATVVVDDLGASLALAPGGAEGRARAVRLTVTIPRRLAVRLEDARRATVSGVAGARIEGLVGDVVIRQVSGPVTGTHRTGRLEVEGAGSVTLNTLGTRASLKDVRQDVTLTVRNGETHITNASGALSIDATNAALVVTTPRGVVRVSVTGGSLDVVRPADAVHIDARRARLLLDLDRAIPATVVAASAAVGLRVDPTQPMAIDAAVSNGTIDASALGLTPEQTGSDAHLTHRRGTDTRVVIRATDGAIVIDSRK